MKLKRRELVFDLVLYVWLAAVVLLTRTLLPGEGVPGWMLTGFLLLLAGAVAVGRSQPSVSLLGAALLSFATFWFAGALWTMAYLHGRRVGPAWPALTVFGVTVGVGTLVSTIRGQTFNAWLATLTVMMFSGFLPWLLGRYRRQRHELVHAGWIQAEILEREQQGIAERARLRERARIAQEMHDSLGHQISLMALRAGAFEVASDLNDRHRQAARQLRESAATTTEQLREIIGMLRDNGDPPPVEPVNETIADLVERAQSAGMAVTLEQPASSTPAPDAVNRTTCAVVREALTNTTKHAPGAPVEIRLSRSLTTTTVTVTNTAPADPPPADRPRGQHGLTGLRERVRLLGGTMTAEPLAGGFQIVVRLPHEADDTNQPMDAPTEPAIDTESWHRIQGERRERRGLVAAAVVPVTGLIAILLSYYSYMTFDAVLDSSSFDTLPIGADQAETTSMLPPRQVPGSPATEPPKPAGSLCHYYTDGNFLVRSHVYRLCFVNGQLVAKDKLVGDD